MTQHDHHALELPAPPGRILLFAAIALGLGAGLAVHLNQPAGPQCVGMVSVRTTLVTAPQEGTVAAWLVREGDPVGIGTPLLKLTNARLGREIVAAEQHLLTLNKELEQTAAAAQLELDWRLHTLAAEVTEVQLRSAGFLREKYDCELQHSMLADLVQGDAVAWAGTGNGSWTALDVEPALPRGDRLAAALRMESAQNAAEVAVAQIELCEQQIARLEILKTQLPERVRQSMSLHLVEARVKEAETHLEQLRAQHRDLVVASPAIGKAGLFKKQVGETISQGEPVLELLDGAQRSLTVHVPSQHIAAFSLGTAVRLTFPGRERRMGRVAHVAPQTTVSSLSLQGAVDAPVSVQVEQTGPVWPEVPVGTRVIVTR